MQKSGTTTEAVQNSHARKQANKLKKSQLAVEQARSLGISVQELARQKTLEAEAIRVESARKNIHVVNVGPPVYQQQEEPPRWSNLFR